jgi:hypothetical protein
LIRAERNVPPSHLSDLGVVTLLENYGRERRHRYFTVASYRSLVDQENLDQTTAEHAHIDLSGVGGFAPLIPGLFYEDETTLFRHQDEFKVKGKSTTSLLKSGLAKQGEQSKRYTTDPRENVTGEETLGQKGVQRKNKRKKDGNEDVDEDFANKPPKRKRGRPRKTKRDEVGDNCEGVLPTQTGIEALEQTEFQATPTVKKRGRPRKNKPVIAPSTDANLSTGLPAHIDTGGGAESIPTHLVSMSGNVGADAPENINGPAASKRRGRSPKKKPSTSNDLIPVVDPLGIQNGGPAPEERRATKRQRIESAGMQDPPMGDEHFVGGIASGDLRRTGDLEEPLSMAFSQPSMPAVSQFPEHYADNFGDSTIGGSSTLPSFETSRTTIESLVPPNVLMADLQPPQSSDTAQRESSVPIDPSIMEEPSISKTSSAMQNVRR